MLYQTICALSKQPSSKSMCEKCRVRNDSQSTDEMKPLNVKNAAKMGKVSVSTKTVVVSVSTLLVLALFLFVTIQFLHPFGIHGIGNPSHRMFFGNPESTFPYSNHVEDTHTSGYDRQRFIINPESICDVATTDDIKLLILVASFIGNFDHRQAIRDTWGSLTTKSGPYRLGFVVGSTMNVTVSQLLQRESEMYHDVIQCSSEDTQEKLTLKSLAMFKWVTEFCPHAKFFLKADDDTYVNFAILSVILNNEIYLSDSNFITGFLKSGAYPEKETDEEGFYSQDDHSDDLVPSYISGSAYLTTGNLSKYLYTVSNELNPLTTKEDVFITGVCARKIGATLIHDDLFRSDKPHATWVTYRSIATGNGLEPSEIYKIWEEMIDSFSVFSSYMNEGLESY